ncbi:hypothetical protein [Leuconostoc fallax]|uniref:Glycosyltransferase RgtA/B/C/D-like domain-containing protein n=1 Tax=Leuconostoc fallax TaxID=1251 RepID=A0A4R5N7Z0_9LACO|nr:hypothetical protein [Leuconostoc fallax]TDG67957.1 hypothetical protein C5L23_000263 [Leuconostoc fallax]
MKVSRIISIMIPIILLIILGLFSIGASPVFYTNQWLDTNAMMTMGRAIHEGVLPFRDIIDQRGPVLYGIYALAAFISSTNFFGLFILEVINVLFVYFITFNMARHLKIGYLKPEWLGLIGPAALLGNNAFVLGGSPEEFAFAPILFVLLVYIKYQSHIEHISLLSFFFVGIAFALVFWSKYSLIAPFVVFFIWTAVALLINKHFLKLLYVILCSLAGFGLVTAIIALIFSMNHALPQLINFYFYQNLNAYGANENGFVFQIVQLIRILARLVGDHFVATLILVVCWSILGLKNKAITLEIVMCLVSLIFVAEQHIFRTYYPLVLFPFLVTGIIRLLAISDARMLLTSRRMLPLIICAVTVLAPFVNNSSLRSAPIIDQKKAFNGQSKSVQERFAKIMHAKYHKPSILMVNTLDSGFYLSANSVPNTPYWHRLNMTYEQLPEMYHSFNHTLNDKRVDYVVVRVPVNQKVSPKLVKASVAPINRQNLFNNYRIITAGTQMTQGNNIQYVLMEKKTLSKVKHHDNKIPIYEKE